MATVFEISPWYFSLFLFTTNFFLTKIKWAGRMLFWEFCWKRFARKAKISRSMDRRYWQLFFSIAVPFPLNLTSEHVKCNFDNPTERILAEGRLVFAHYQKFMKTYAFKLKTSPYVLLDNFQVVLRTLTKKVATKERCPHAEHGRKKLFLYPRLKSFPKKIFSTHRTRFWQQAEKVVTNSRKFLLNIRKRNDNFVNF